MNALYTAGTRQISSIQSDLALMEEGKGTAAVQGQITTTLNALSRVIDDYDQMAKKEMKTDKREKALLRVSRFKEEYKDLKLQLEKHKNMGIERARAELLSGSASSSSTSHQGGLGTARHRPNAPPSPLLESPFSNSNSHHPNELYPAPNAREDFALREHTFLQEAENSLDQYIAQGRSVLENLVEQKGMLRGTKRKLMGAAETLGLSRETIGWINRRSAQDVWIFFGGAIFTLFMFWVIWHYLG